MPNLPVTITSAGGTVLSYNFDDNGDAVDPSTDPTLTFMDDGRTLLVVLNGNTAGAIRIRKPTVNGFVLETPSYGSWSDTGINSPAGAGVPAGLGVNSANGDFITVGAANNMLYTYTASTGTWDAGVAGPASGVLVGCSYTPFGGNAVLNTNNRRIQGYDGTDWSNGIEVPASLGSLNGMAYGDPIRLFVLGDDAFYERVGLGEWPSTALPSALTDPGGIAVTGNNEHILVVDSTSNLLYRYSNGRWDSGTAVASGVTGPIALAANRQGNIYTVSGTVSSDIHTIHFGIQGMPIPTGGTTIIGPFTREVRSMGSMPVNGDSSLRGYLNRLTLEITDGDTMHLSVVRI